MIKIVFWMVPANSMESAFIRQLIKAMAMASIRRWYVSNHFHVKNKFSLLWMNQIYRWVFVYSFYWVTTNPITIYLLYLLENSPPLISFKFDLQKKWFQRRLDCEYQILLSREVGCGDEWEQPFDIINYFFQIKYYPNIINNYLLLIISKKTWLWISNTFE